MSATTPVPLLRPIASSEQPQRKWEVRLDGEPVPAASLVEVRSRYGVLRYGWTAGGYDGWSFREPGGGGAGSEGTKPPPVHPAAGKL